MNMCVCLYCDDEDVPRVSHMLSKDSAASHTQPVVWSCVFMLTEFHYQITLVSQMSLEALSPLLLLFFPERECVKQRWLLQTPQGINSLVEPCGSRSIFWGYFHILDLISLRIQLLQCVSHQERGGSLGFSRAVSPQLSCLSLQRG